MVSFARRTDNPDILFLQQTHGTRQVGHTDQRHAFGCAAGHLFRRCIKLCRTIFRHNDRMYASGVCATQTGAEVMRIGHAVEDQQEGIVELRDQIRKIVFLILASRLHARNDPLMYRTLAFFIKILAVRQLDHHALRFQRMDQRQQAFIFPPFQNKDVLKALWRTFQQSLHRVDAVNHFTH